MLEAIIGGMLGSVYARSPVRGRWEDLPLLSPMSRFTDDLGNDAAHIGGRVELPMP